MCAQSTSKTILVVEDDTDTREFYEFMLQEAGYGVLSAWSGQQARASMALMARLSIDGVLLDYRLPDTIGLELCQDPRAALGPDVPILLVTADSEPMLEARAIAAGATAFLGKPIDPNGLLTLLTAYVPGADRT